LQVVVFDVENGSLQLPIRVFDADNSNLSLQIT
jgi:hypothetical protein